MLTEVTGSHMAKCYLEIDDPRLGGETICYVDYSFHAQTITVIITHLNGQVVEKIRCAYITESTIHLQQEAVRSWHTDNKYLLPTLCRGSGKKITSHNARHLFVNVINENPAMPIVQPPWVTNAARFGTWRPRLLHFDDYHLIEVVIDGEKCFVCWWNLSQACSLTIRGPLYAGFDLAREDGSYCRVDPYVGVNLADISAHSPFITIPAYSRVNPPGVAPRGFDYSTRHDISKHSIHRTNAVESELSENLRAMESRKKSGDIEIPLDDEGFPLMVGSVNGIEVYVERETYWKECYLSVSIDGEVLAIALQRTNGTNETLHITTNKNVLSAFHRMLEVWRKLWPDQIPGFVRDVSAEWAGRQPIKVEPHWFDANYGFKDKWTGIRENATRTLPGGGTETEADVTVREVSDGFGFKLTFGDGSAEVIHFNTADLIQGRDEIKEVIDMWKTFQGETRGKLLRWPKDREVPNNDWTLSSIANTGINFIHGFWDTSPKTTYEGKRKTVYHTKGSLLT